LLFHTYKQDDFYSLFFIYDMWKNIIGFNISWFGLVYVGNSFIPLCVIFLYFHYRFLVKNNSERLFMLTIWVIGIVVDSLLMYLNVFIFVENYHLPFWLIMLWGCFSTTLCHSLKFIGSSIWFQIIAGFIAPFSYLAGYKLGAVQFSESLMFTYLILMIIWAVLFILFFALKSTFLDKEHRHV